MSKEEVSEEEMELRKYYMEQILGIKMVNRGTGEKVEISDIWTEEWVSGNTVVVELTYVKKNRFGDARKIQVPLDMLKQYYKRID